MPLYDDYTLKVLRESSPEQKLNGLRHDMLRESHQIRAVLIFLKSIDSESVKNLPEDFNYWIDILSQTSDNVLEILEVFTGAEKPT